MHRRSGGAGTACLGRTHRALARVFCRPCPLWGILGGARKLVRATRATRRADPTAPRFRVCDRRS
eukprot:493565-Prymnesium_polylepis.1